MRHATLLAAALLLAGTAATRAAHAGDGCGATPCCDPCCQIACGPTKCCEKVVCQPITKAVPVDKTCYGISCKYLCLPKCKLPWDCGKSCGCCEECPPCAEGVAVKRLRKFKVVSEKCVCDFEAVPCPCGCACGDGCAESGTELDEATPPPAVVPDDSPKKPTPVPPSAALPRRKAAR